MPLPPCTSDERPLAAEVGSAVRCEPVDCGLIQIHRAAKRLYFNPRKRHCEKFVNCTTHSADGVLVRVLDREHNLCEQLHQETDFPENQATGGAASGINGIARHDSSGSGSAAESPIDSCNCNHGVLKPECVGDCSRCHHPCQCFEGWNTAPPTMQPDPDKAWQWCTLEDNTDHTSGTLGGDNDQSPGQEKGGPNLPLDQPQSGSSWKIWGPSLLLILIVTIVIVTVVRWCRRRDDGDAVQVGVNQQ